MRIIPAASDLPADPPELIFQWERRSRAHWRLAGIVGLVILAHAVSFYLIQVAYTPTGSQLPPPAQVVMIAPDQPGTDAFARWLAMADPALVVQPTGPTTAETLASLDFHYVPSYKTAKSGFKSLDPLPGEGVVAPPPRPRMPGPVPIVGVNAGTGAKPPPTQLGRRTRVVLTGGVESFLDAPLPPVQFTTARRGEPLEPTAFLVGLRPEGGSPFLFLKSKPGNAAADEFAHDYLARLNFRPVGGQAEGVVWGWAEFAWGNETYLPAEDKKTNS